MRMKFNIFDEKSKIRDILILESTTFLALLIVLITLVAVNPKLDKRYSASNVLINALKLSKYKSNEDVNEVVSFTYSNSDNSLLINSRTSDNNYLVSLSISSTDFNSILLELSNPNTDLSRYEVVYSKHNIIQDDETTIEGLFTIYESGSKTLISRTYLDNNSTYVSISDANYNIEDKTYSNGVVNSIEKASKHVLANLYKLMLD